MNKRNSRDLFPGTGAGKGDAERSPGWRDNYDSIDFHRHQPNAAGTALEPKPDGFTRVSPARIRKVYR